MSFAFKENLDLIIDGQPVNAATTNRPIQQVQNNVRYLKSIIEAAELSEAVFHRNATVESAALVGQPVYYNSTNERFERAISDTTEKENVVGLVAKKSNPITADIVVFGRVILDLSNAVSPVNPGRYYLSNTTPGGLTLNPPNTDAITVCLASGTGIVWVIPQHRRIPPAINSQTGTTTNANLSLFTRSSNSGLRGIGTVKNTGSTNNLIVRVEVTDAFAVSSSEEFVITPGSQYKIDLYNALHPAYPPFTNVNILVRSAIMNQHTNYSAAFAME